MPFFSTCTIRFSWLYFCLAISQFAVHVIRTWINCQKRSRGLIFCCLWTVDAEWLLRVDAGGHFLDITMWHLLNDNAGLIKKKNVLEFGENVFLRLNIAACDWLRGLSLLLWHHKVSPNLYDTPNSLSIKCVHIAFTLIHLGGRLGKPVRF